jgi:hypothetical protein
MASVAQMPDSEIVKIVFDDGEIRFGAPVKDGDVGDGRGSELHSKGQT